MGLRKSNECTNLRHSFVYIFIETHLFYDTYQVHEFSIIFNHAFKLSSTRCAVLPTGLLATHEVLGGYLVPARWYFVFKRNWTLYLVQSLIK